MSIKKTTESDIVKQFLDYLKKLPNIYAFRVNTTGVKRTVKGKSFWTFGGERGVSDILGIYDSIKSLTGGIFLAIEVKKEGNHLTPEQEAFLDRIKSNGGIAIVAHNLDELQSELRAEGVID